MAASTRPVARCRGPPVAIDRRSKRVSTTASSRCSRVADSCRGREVTITASHPLLTARGWRPLRDRSAVGDGRRPVPTRLAVFGDDEPDRPPTSTGSPSSTVGPRRDRGPAAFRPPSSASRGRARPLPEPFVRVRGARRGWRATRSCRIGYPRASEQLAADVSHLLLRFGIRAKRAQRPSDRPHDRPAFEVEIIDSASLHRVRRRDRHPRQGRTPSPIVRADAARRTLGGSNDAVPVEVWDDIVKAAGELIVGRAQRALRQPPLAQLARRTAAGSSKAAVAAARRSARRRPAAVVGLARRVVGRDRGDRRRSARRGSSTSRFRGSTTSSPPTSICTTRRSGSGWRPTWPSTARSRCSCSRSRWATPS